MQYDEDDVLPPSAVAENVGSEGDWSGTQDSETSSRNRGRIGTTPLAVVTFLLFRDSLRVDARQTTFHGLYSRYAADVYRFAHWLTGNPDDAQDITSETFVRAWTAPEEPRMETVKAYLFTIARNLHRKQWRRQSRLEALDEAMPGQAVQPDEAAVNQDEFRQTLKAVQTLPEIDRTVLLLRAEQELSYEDIAAVTGLSVAAAKVRVFRARAKLATLLHPNLGEKT
jgi:RNA polymerase sigma-70 factor (ECF subfamily)